MRALTSSAASSKGPHCTAARLALATSSRFAARPGCFMPSFAEALLPFCTSSKPSRVEVVWLFEGAARLPRSTANVCQQFEPIHHLP